MQQIKRYSIFCLFTIFLLTYSILGQETKDSESEPIEYINLNFLDMPAEKVRVLKGYAIDINGYKVSFNLRVGIFTEDGKELIAETEADEDGKFHFEDIPKGIYRIVGRVENDLFCPVNFKINKLKYKKQSKLAKKQIVLIMIPRAIDTCSYGDVK